MMAEVKYKVIGTPGEAYELCGWRRHVRLTLYNADALKGPLNRKILSELAQQQLERDGTLDYKSCLAWAPYPVDAEWIGVVPAEHEARQGKDPVILNTEENGREVGIPGCELALYPAFELRHRLAFSEGADPVSLGKLFTDECIVPPLGTLVWAPRWWGDKVDRPYRVRYPQ
jgi:hypothetical protein